MGATGATSSQAAVRYYEVNVTGGTVAANATQAFTFSPDATVHRFMPSVAMDHAGDMAIGYSAVLTVAFDSPDTDTKRHKLQCGLGSLRRVQRNSEVVGKNIRGSRRNYPKVGVFANQAFSDIPYSAIAATSENDVVALRDGFFRLLG